MSISLLENKYQRISKITVLAPLRTKLLYPVWDEIYEIPCKFENMDASNGYHEWVYSNTAVRYMVVRFSRNSSANLRKKSKQTNLKLRSLASC